MPRFQLAAFKPSGRAHKFDTLAGLSDMWMAYRLRWKRRRLLLRAWRKRHELTPLKNRTATISPDQIICFVTVRNEMQRLPYFLAYYRQQGIGHFIFVDNNSDDGTTGYLSQQSDTSLWHTKHSYKSSRFGMDWLGWLLRRYGHGHWCLTVDADEILVFPRSSKTTLTELTTQLEAKGQLKLGAVMLDMYPKGPLGQGLHDPNADPFDQLNWFDPAGYFYTYQRNTRAYWLQGGARARVFFEQEPLRAPTLNKIPLVRWDRKYTYLTSTHMILPRDLNAVFVDNTETTGVLLHSKFLPQIIEKSEEEKSRREHFENSDLYGEYYDRLIKGESLWHPNAAQYQGWSQLVELGLMHDPEIKPSIESI